MRSPFNKLGGQYDVTYNKATWYDGVHRRKAAQKVSRALFDLGMPKDIVVVTESDVRSYGANPSLVIASALAEGRELYQVSYHPKKWIIRLLKPVNHEKD
jgi:hypothetical protein